jgi:hypothetical protein
MSSDTANQFTLSQQRTHESVRWDSNIECWYCPKCGRTSDHITIEDARIEIQQFECVFEGTCAGDLEYKSRLL